jgi:nicotinate-nucleotide adenylyltransferase
MSTLCFGGSFNPIHNGHILCAKAVAQTRRFEKVLLIPSARPPHKAAAADLADSADRLAICRLVAADDPTFHVDDLELRRNGPSYTIDTARELKRRGFSQVNWLIGADMLNGLPTWHEPLALLQEVNFVIMNRPGQTIDFSMLPPPFRELQSHLVDAPLIDISATEIRRRVREGKSIDTLVPPAVVKYILDHHLYR